MRTVIRRELFEMIFKDLRKKYPKPDFNLDRRMLRLAARSLMKKSWREGHGKAS